MTSIIGEPDDDGTEHIATCPVCGRRFDMRDLGQVYEHVHDGPEMPPIVIPPPAPSSD